MKPPEPYRSRIRAHALARRDRGALWYQRGKPSGVVALEYGDDVTPEQREAFEAELAEAVKRLGGRVRPAG